MKACSKTLFCSSALFFICQTNLFSQNLKVNTNTYKWTELSPEAIPLSDIFKNEDVVILDEKTEIKILSQKDVAFENLQFNTSVFSHLRIKFLTQKGIDGFSEIWLPSCFDPSGDYADVPFADRTKVHRPKMSITGINDISGRVWGADKMIKAINFSLTKEAEDFIFYRHSGLLTNDDVGDAKYDSYILNSNFLTMYSKEYENFLIPKTLLQNEFLDNMRSSTLHAFNFKITNVKPGDEVELVYSYKTLTENNRVFFHSLLPKQNLSLSVSYATNEVYFFDFFNNAQPTLMPKADNESKERTYVWEMKNLPAYKNEVNSRPHTNLPYFTYYYHYRDFGKLKSNGDYEQFLPYIWEAYYRRYVNYVEKGFKIDYSRNEQLSKRFFNRPDKNTMTLNRFFESRTANIPDTFLIKRFMSIHNHITDSFNYDNDKEWFKEGFMKVKNISKVIDDKTLHNVSRTRLYYEMASRLRDDFYITMLADKRIENTDLNKYKPMIRWKYFYVIPYQGSYFFFYPKLDRFGHYANEMPFYNENNITFLIPQAIPDSSTWHEHTIISFPRTATPYSSIADNVRTSQILVNVNTQRNQADFATRVELKGQYSTLTRGFYQYESKDPLVSENYYHKIWEIPGCVKPDSVNVTENSKDFPFAYHFTAYYQTDKLLTKNQDGSFSIHLKDLLRFITEKNLDTTKRITDFYPDFIGQDTYKYYFKFDHAITVSNAEEINFEEKNSFGALRIQVMNAQPNVILLESKLVVNAERVAATSITEVAWLCNVLDKLDQRSLVIK